MKLITKLKFVAAFALLAAIPFAAGVYTERASAQDNQPQEQQEERQEDSEPADYTYTAQPGDSYTLMARKAVQTYGINNNVNLSLAQIVYAETMLTQGADSPELNEGQEVTIQQADVKSWIEKAQDLSEADEVAWQPYTVGVDFNTDNVGESRA